MRYGRGGCVKLRPALSQSSTSDHDENPSKAGTIAIQPQPGASMQTSQRAPATEDARSTASAKRESDALTDETAVGSVQESKDT
ncbi:hypothetical protein BD309DRAFT_974454 [Dichomitus squalens]|nr:hypothetical protein BD309DRAFT_974454 [Dichomitus squalens]